MATSGAFNGTDVFIRMFDSSTSRWLTIGGQRSHTETMTSRLIDITNKISNPKYRTLLPDEGIQEVTYSVDMVFNSETAFSKLRAMAGTKAQANFQVQRGDITGTGVIATEVTLQVQSFADTSADGDALSATVSLMSSDAFIFDSNQSYEVFITSDGDNFLTSTSDQLLVEV